MPENIKIESNWSAIKVVGSLDFNLTGILASLANSLAIAKISIFAVSTFDTDYILVRKHDLNKALNVLCEAGHDVQF